MNDRITYISNSAWAKAKLNAATTEIEEYQNRINAAKVAIDEYSDMIPKFLKLGNYNALNDCARNIAKHAEFIVSWQNQINHIQTYIDGLF
jgi:hypothetical protein